MHQKLWETVALSRTRYGSSLSATQSGGAPPIDWMTVNTNELSLNAFAASHTVQAPYSKPFSS